VQQHLQKGVLILAPIEGLPLLPPITQRDLKAFYLDLEGGRGVIDNLQAVFPLFYQLPPVVLLLPLENPLLVEENGVAFPQGEFYGTVIAPPQGGYPEG